MPPIGLPHNEAIALLSIQKFGALPDDWARNKALPFVHEMDFGLTDADGARIKGLTVSLAVRRGKSVPYNIWDFTLFLYEVGWPQRRVYQLSINTRAGLRPRDHDYPHEHVGDAPRSPLSDEWPSWSYEDAFQHFATRIRLEADTPPDPGVLRLRP